MGALKLRRRLLGFSPQDVHHLLAEREFATGQAQERAESVERKLTEALGRLQAAEQNAQAAEERAAAAEEVLRRLEAELAPARQELSRKGEEIASLRSQVSELRREIQAFGRETAATGGAPGSDPVTGLLMREIAPIVEAAKLSAATMLEEARKAAQRQADEAKETHDLLHRQAQSMASWWHGVHGLVDPITASLERSKSQIELIPARVQDALSPLAELMTSVSDQLAELARMAEPPSFESEAEREPMVLDLTATEKESTEDPEDESERETPVVAEHERAHPPWRPVSWWPYAGSSGGRSAAS